MAPLLDRNSKDNEECLLFDNRLVRSLAIGIISESSCERYNKVALCVQFSRVLLPHEPPLEKWCVVHDTEIYRDKFER